MGIRVPALCTALKFAMSCSRGALLEGAFEAEQDAASARTVRTRCVRKAGVDRPGQLRGSAVRRLDAVLDEGRRKPAGSGVEFLPRPHPEVRSPAHKSPQWSAVRRCAFGRSSPRTRCRKRNKHKVRLAALHAPRIEGANEAGLARARAERKAHLARSARANAHAFIGANGASPTRACCLKIEFGK